MNAHLGSVLQETLRAVRPAPSANTIATGKWKRDSGLWKRHPDSTGLMAEDMGQSQISDTSWKDDDEESSHLQGEEAQGADRSPLGLLPPAKLFR